MELVDGVDLGRLVEAQRRKTPGAGVPAALGAFLIAEAARGLAYAHDRRAPSGALLGIVHRDVSPQNILVSYAGEVKIADFGIAKAAGKLHKTASNAIMGKLRYMSPEQVTGEPLDGRSDVFSLGTVLWELLTSAQLFHGEHPGQVTEQVKKAEVPAPSTRVAAIPAELDRIVLKALARDREARYARAADLAKELSTFAAEAQPGLSRDELASYISALVPRTPESSAPKSNEPAAVAPTVPRPVAVPTEQGHKSPTPKKKTRWPVYAGGSAIAILIGAVALRGGPAKLVLPPIGAADLGQVSVVSTAPVATVSAAEKERLLASLEQLPQAEAAWRGVQAEDYLAILSAVEASLCATPSGTRDPSLPADVLDRLERRKVTGEARALARYALLTGELPERVGLSLRAFLRGRPAFSPGANGWALAGLATLIEPDQSRHLEELVRQNGALHRWCESPPPGQPSARFAEICERSAAVSRLAARVPGPLAASLVRFLAALPIEQSVDEGGLRYAVIGAERDEAAATLSIRLRVTNPGADEKSLPLESARLAGWDAAPTIDPAGAKLGPSLVREVKLVFGGVPDAVADAAVLALRPGILLQAYSEVLR
jgi:hypothetical protein